MVSKLKLLMLLLLLLLLLMGWMLRLRVVVLHLSMMCEDFLCMRANLIRCAGQRPGLINGGWGVRRRRWRLAHSELRLEATMFLDGCLGTCPVGLLRRFLSYGRRVYSGRGSREWGSGAQ